MGRMRWLNPLLTCANTVEVVCLTTLTWVRKYPASTHQKFPRLKSQGQFFSVILTETIETAHRVFDPVLRYWSQYRWDDRAP